MGILFTNVPSGQAQAHADGGYSKVPSNSLNRASATSKLISRALTGLAEVKGVSFA